MEFKPHQISIFLGQIAADTKNEIAGSVADRDGEIDTRDISGDTDVDIEKQSQRIQSRPAFWTRLRVALVQLVGRHIGRMNDRSFNDNRVPNSTAHLASSIVNPDSANHLPPIGRTRTIGALGVAHSMRVYPGPRADPPGLPPSVPHHSSDMLQVDSLLGVPGEHHQPLPKQCGYVSIDPFRSPGGHVHNMELPTAGNPKPSNTSGHKIAGLLNTALKELYHFIFLHLPALYFSRVTRIFQEIELDADQLKAIVVDHLRRRKADGQDVARHHQYFVNPRDAEDVSELIFLWESFIDTLIQEYNAISIVSVMLLTAIASMMQIEAAFGDPVVRNLLFMTLICNLWSVIYGYLYIIRFSGMKRIHKAVEWAKEGAAGETTIFWNMWVLLAMPAIWLAWSLIFFVALLLVFAWRTGTGGEAGVITAFLARNEWVARSAFSVMVLMGFVYLMLMLHTLRRYGGEMDKKWKGTIRATATSGTSIPGSFMASPAYFPRNIEPSPATPPPHVFPTNVLHASSEQFPDGLPPIYPPGGSGIHAEGASLLTVPRRTPTPDILRTPPRNSASSIRPSLADTFQRALEIINLDIHHTMVSLPPILALRGITPAQWSAFTQEVIQAWRGARTPGRESEVIDVLHSWNAALFINHALVEAVLCTELVWQGHSAHPALHEQWVVYITDLQFSPDLATRFGPISPNVYMVKVWRSLNPEVIIPKPTWAVESLSRRRRCSSFDTLETTTASFDVGTLNTPPGRASPLPDIIISPPTRPSSPVRSTLGSAGSILSQRQGDGVGIRLDHARTREYPSVIFGGMRTPTTRPGSSVTHRHEEENRASDGSLLAKAKLGNSTRDSSEGVGIPLTPQSTANVSSLPDTAGTRPRSPVSRTTENFSPPTPASHPFVNLNHFVVANQSPSPEHDNNTRSPNTPSVLLLPDLSDGESATNIDFHAAFGPPAPTPPTPSALLPFPLVLTGIPTHDSDEPPMSVQPKPKF